jgi:hypothetical protein
MTSDESPMSIVLLNQLDASERSADALEDELKRPEIASLALYAVDDLVKSVVDLYGTLSRDVERWQDAIAKATARPPQSQLEEIAATWDALWRRLAKMYERAWSFVKLMESAGYEIDGKQELLRTWRDVRAVTSFDLDRVSTAVEQLRRGESEPL